MKSNSEVIPSLAVILRRKGLQPGGHYLDNQADFYNESAPPAEGRPSASHASNPPKGICCTGSLTEREPELHCDNMVILTRILRQIPVSTLWFAI